MTVAVVGSINMDVVARVPRIPGPGETLLASGSSRGGGGKGANQAVAAARAGGVPTAFIGAVGDDADGAQLRAWLEDDGIDVSGLSRDEAPSGVALIAVSDDAENSIIVVPGANQSLTALADAQRALVAGADVIAAQLEIPIDLVVAAAEARGEGALFVLNAAPSAPLLDAADRVLPLVDVLIVNEHELIDIAGVTDRDAAVDALSARVPALVVTLGAAGSLIAVGAERAIVPAFPVDPVDTTGAGDTFCGVLAARLGRGPLSLEALAAAAHAGAAAAAIAVTRVGAQAAVPTAAEVEELLA
ncbi:PfkB family carbohydrate kinase [Microbacterium sediminis]|uniref:PfkB family carbohydrate kinase n=1 Tax=Microbacterium sediminis TaxID=904291 RepID=UPI0010719526|nr:PfkB family carbohydrate kinase [Microbacterium sediminis]QBR73277.1 ribokinase [Microbacterium sediminis]